MGRNLSNHSESPVRDRGGSPFKRSTSRKSPYRRERSPVQHRSSRRGSPPAREKERHSSRAKSPMHAQSQSPVSHSPSPHTRRLMRARDEREAGKVTGRDRGRNHSGRSDRGTRMEKSLSPSPRSKRSARARDGRVAEKVTERDHERNNGRGNDKEKHGERSHSPVSRSPSPRTRRLKRAQAERGADKLTNHSRTSDKEPHSPISRSPSPRTKRLRRTDIKVTEREPEKNHGRASDKDTHGDRGLDKETGSDRKERRDRVIERDRKDRKLGRDEANNKTSSPRSRHDRSTSPLDQPYRGRHRSRSPQSPDAAQAHHKVTNSRGAEHRNDESDSVTQMKAAEDALQAKEKQKPSFELSGKLAAETNRFRGVTLLFNEPPDARKPNVRWRLYVFKGGEVLKEPLYIHRQSCYLFGRERRVADIPTDHPSCSKQHAVIQFRQVEKEQPDGMLTKQVRPYLMDLGSTNKTHLNEILLNLNVIMNFLKKTPLNLVIVAVSMYYCMRTPLIEWRQRALIMQEGGIFLGTIRIMVATGVWRWYFTLLFPS